MTHDPVLGKCLDCYSGYQLSNDKCVRQQLDPGCKSYKNGVCEECSGGYYFKIFNGQRRCSKIDDKCKNFDIQAGQCRECYPGYTLNLINECIQEAPSKISDPNCRLWSNEVCT